MKKTIENAKELNMDSLINLITNKNLVHEVEKNEAYCDLYTYITFDNLPLYLQDEITKTLTSDLKYPEIQNALTTHFKFRFCNSVEFNDDTRTKINVYGNFLEVYSEVFLYEKMFAIQPLDDSYTESILNILTEHVEM